jgi:hypothetical protein
MRIEEAQAKYSKTYFVPVEIVTAFVGDQLWHRVCVGHYASATEAEDALADLKLSGQISDGLVRRLLPASASAD